MKKLIKNQKGQGVLEYVILTSLIGMLTIGMLGQFGTTLKNKISDMKIQINHTIKNKKN